MAHSVSKISLLFTEEPIFHDKKLLPFITFSLGAGPGDFTPLRNWEFFRSSHVCLEFQVDHTFQEVLPHVLASREWQGEAPGPLLLTEKGDLWPIPAALGHTWKQ